MRVKCILLYFGAVLVWFVLFSTLKKSCIVSIPWNIEKLWSEQIDKDFIKNLAGEIAFHATPFDYMCGYRFIYTAEYYPNGVSSDYKLVSLTDSVDLGSWKEIESDSATTTYTDNSYRYILYNNSDGIYMGIFDK